MDLTTLPKEMLANILKYKDCDFTHKLRTTNSYVNETVKQFANFKHIPLKTLEIFPYGPDPCSWSVKLRMNGRTVDLLWILKRNAKSYELEEKTYNIPGKIEEIEEELKEMGRRFSFISDIYIEKIELGQKFFSIIEDHKEAFEHCTQLKLCNPKITLSKEELKKLLDNLPKLNAIDISDRHDERNSNSNAILNAEVLGDRNWDRIFFTANGTVLHLELDDEFLLDVVVNCKAFKIDTKNLNTTKKFFTFQGVIDMIEEKCALSLPSSYINIGTITIDWMSIIAVENSLRLRKNINNYRKYDTDTDLIYYTVYFGKTAVSSIHFAVSKVAS